MDTVTLKGRKYVKAAIIAKDLGYTSDYVGQLCRSEKIDAALVGRSWYVNPDSLKAYRSDVSRSNASKSKAAVAAYKKSVHATRSSSPRHLVVASYESDDTDLIPHTHPKEAEAEPETNVKVRSESKKNKFKAADKPKITFTGNVSLTDVETQSNDIRDTPTATVTERIKPVAKKAAKSSKKENHIHVQTVEEEALFTPVSIHIEKPNQPKRRALVPGLLLCVLLPSLFVLSLMLERKIMSGPDESTVTYRLNPDVIFDIIKL